MAEPDCWYVNFDAEFTSQTVRECMANEISTMREPGCYIVHKGDGLSCFVDVMGGGKTGAHEKRRAAKKNPEADWVKRSVFIVRRVQ